MTLADLFRGVINTINVNAGETIFEKGQPGDVMFLIKEGMVEIKLEEKTLQTFSKGDIFGEMALISDEPRSATAIAKTSCKLLPVNEEHFLFLVQQTPYFSLHVMNILAQRLRNMDITL